MENRLQDLRSNLERDSSYAAKVLEKLRNGEWVKVQDYSEFRMIKDIASVEGLKVRYKEHTGRVVAQKSY
jgi:hypothetical protein